MSKVHQGKVSKLNLLLRKWFGHKWNHYSVGRHWQNPPHNELVKECKRCYEYEVTGYDFDI